MSSSLHGLMSIKERSLNIVMGLTGTELAKDDMEAMSSEAVTDVVEHLTNDEIELSEEQEENPVLAVAVAEVQEAVKDAAVETLVEDLVVEDPTVASDQMANLSDNAITEVVAKIEEEEEEEKAEEVQAQEINQRDYETN